MPRPSSPRGPTEVPGHMLRLQAGDAGRRSALARQLRVARMDVRPQPVNPPSRGSSS
jgi:hypothetical protein